MVRTLLTNKYGVIETEIDMELQTNNNYTKWGMFLVRVEGGVVWGYDTERYEYRGDEIAKKQGVKSSYDVSSKSGSANDSHDDDVNNNS